MDKSGLNKFIGLFKAKNCQISSVDKLISQNKLIQNLISTQNGDKVYGLFQVGSTMIQVKQEVNFKSLVGGGFNGTRFAEWGPLRWPQIITKVVVVTGWSAAAGQYAHSAGLFDQVWGPQKGSQYFSDFWFLKISY